MRSYRPWREIYEGGSPEAEQAIFRSMAREMRKLQVANLEKAGARHLTRMMYAKTVAGVTNASLIVDRVMPAELAIAHFHPGARLPVVMRLSNASGVAQTDGAPDMRGVALRILLPRKRVHDLLLASHPTSIARDARQFFEVAMTSIGDRETLLARLASRLGLSETHRIAVSLKRSLKLCSSLALQHFWSGCAFLWGDQPVHFELRPVATENTYTGQSTRNNDALRLDLAERLATGDVQFRLAVQKYVDERRTPVEDATVKWKKQVSPPIEIATVVIPKHDMLGEEAEAARARVDRLAFDPWNAPPQFRPLGSLNRARRIVYETSAQARLSGSEPF
ncbi:MAG: hypothetical protein WDO56_29870 [Gammaproteobacteria bacterium]